MITHRHIIGNTMDTSKLNVIDSQTGEYLVQDLIVTSEEISEILFHNYGYKATHMTETTSMEMISEQPNTWNLWVNCKQKELSNAPFSAAN